MSETLQTPRMTLRLLRPDDLDVVHALFSDDGHTVGDGPLVDPRLTLEWLKRRGRLYAASGLAWYGLWDRKEGFVGTCGAFRGRCGVEPEIGYEVAVHRRDRGYATEAVSIVTHAAHSAGHGRLWATIRPANRASVRTVVANGYVMVRCEFDERGALDFYVHEIVSQP